jgi:hypothetical protein
MSGRLALRALTMILLVIGAGVLEGCVYDPYTGTYVPCCAYPAYYYPYPYYYGRPPPPPRRPPPPAPGQPPPAPPQ